MKVKSLSLSLSAPRLLCRIPIANDRIAFVNLQARNLPVFASMTRRPSLWNQIAKSLQAETAEIYFTLAVDDLLRERLADRGGVLESMA